MDIFFSFSVTKQKTKTTKQNQKKPNIKTPTNPLKKKTPKNTLKKTKKTKKSQKQPNQKEKVI